MLFAQPQFAVRKSLQVSRTISSGAILDWGVRKMKVIIQLRATARALSITSLHLFLIFFLCLALPALAAAQDPLGPRQYARHRHELRQTTRATSGSRAL